MSAAAHALHQRHCSHAVAALGDGEIARLLPLLDGWVVHHAKLCKSFGFDDYYATIAFVNALAYLAHGQDHHPALLVTFKNCTVSFDTHSVGGISENDFICAAKADALYAQRPAGAAQ
jgi:4a-hydroxytetrahydrobiopterin dehydratase